MESLCGYLAMWMSEFKERERGAEKGRNKDSETKELGMRKGVE